MQITSLILVLCSLTLARNPPNIIIIYMDDMGYNDLGVNARESLKKYPELNIPNFIETPRLDKMAAEGVRFTDFYSASSVCTPSRAALLTGSYPMRTGSNAVTGAAQTGGLNPNEITIADLLKRKNYATAAIGKWHLGVGPKFLPIAHGFDSYFGIPYSNDMWLNTQIPLSKAITLREGYTLDKMKLAQVDQASVEKYTQKTQVPLVRNDSIIEYPADQSTLTKRYTDEAIKFIQKNALSSRPFFLYLPHSMPHTPLSVSEGFKTNPSCALVKATEGCGLYADVIEEVDYNIGRLLDVVKEAGIDSNTLVIFSSDNGRWSKGPENQGSSLPFQGAKFSAWEGGHREPAIMRWPGTIPKGNIQPSITSTIDLLPTIASIVGIPLPFGKMIEGKPYAIDGLNIFDRLLNSDSIARATPFFYQEANASNFMAIRIGQWKYVNGSAGQDPDTKGLYNLAKDIQEKFDVSASNPTIKSDLEKKLQEFNAKMNAEKRSTGTPSTPEPLGGCTNPDASNYNSQAMRDNGTCQNVSPLLPHDALEKKDIRIHKLGQNIVFELPKPGKAFILNPLGKTVYTFNAQNSLIHTLPTRSLKPGIYFLILGNGGGQKREKLVIY